MLRSYYITPVTTLKTRHGTTISSVHVIIGRYRFKLGALSDSCYQYFIFVSLSMMVLLLYMFVFINFVQNPGCFNLGFVMIDYAQHVLNTLILYK